MIFSRLFAPSHTSQNPEKRLEAIQNLSPEKPTEKTILHELAFNDENADVSLSALSKLNSFVLWLKMSQIANNAKVKRVAERTVEATLNGQGDVKISPSEKKAFLRESANAEIIQQILVNDDVLLGDSELVLALLTKVDKPSFTSSVFLNHADLVLQQAILSTLNDVSVVQKLEKKCREQDIHPQIISRLAALKAEAEKPIALMRDITLCLSKYQALTDKTDVEEIDTRQAELRAEYQVLMEQSHVFSSDQKQEVEAKLSRIEDKITRYLARIRPQWEVTQAANEKANIEALCEQQLNHASGQVHWLYSERLCEATLADVAAVNESVRGLEATLEHLESLDQSSRLVEKVRQTLFSLNRKLEAFSLQQQYGQKLLVCLSQLEALAEVVTGESVPQSEDETLASNTPATIDAELVQINDKYALLRAELIAIPNSLNKRWQAASRVFKQQKQTQKAEIESVLRQCRKHISVIDNLIAQGRYRNAISKFEKLTSLYNDLSESAKSQLRKRYDKTADEIAHLEGWQDYIAAPRKPALIEEANTLAAAPADDIKQRSDAIRYLRQQWLSLGSGSDDAELQSAFDAAIELAFQPCRAYYAALDAQRTEALKSRQALIESVAKVDMSCGEAELAKNLDHLLKQWHDCGQVEKKDYETIKQQWKAGIKPLQVRVNSWYSENKKAKQQLVNQTQLLLEGDDIASASEKAQQLQQEWKAIGHAGKRDESRLWRAFRAENDKVFERLKEVKKAQSLANDSVFKALLSDLDTINSASEEKDISAVIQRVESQAKDLPAVLRGKLDKRIFGIQKQQQSRESERHQHRLQQRAQAVISLLQQGLSDEDMSRISDDDAEVLGKRWKGVLLKRAEGTHSRHWLTVALETASNRPSPASDSNMRTDVQLSMMTAKLEKGEHVSATQLLEAWIAQGEVNSDDGHLLARVIEVIDKTPEVVG